MSGKGPGEMAIFTSAVNAQVYIEILDTFLIPSIEKKFGDNGVIFQDDNASCHRAKSISFSSGKTYQLNDMASKQSRSQSD